MDISIEVHVDSVFLEGIEHDKLNSLDLRSDIENNNIFDTILKSSGYVGNRPEIFEGDHPDDTWAIDCYTADGQEVTAYLYVSEYEYEQDLALIKEFA